MNRIKTWHFLSLLCVISTLAVLYEIPAQTLWHTATWSLVAGVVALVYMGASCVLATRWKWVEDLFGGLDRVYETHKWLGIWALVLASFHFLFKAKLNIWDISPILEIEKNWARFFRQLSFVGLGAIILLALNRNIRYSIWRWLHKLSGPVFLVVVLHWLSQASPIALGSPAGIWLAIVSILGVSGAFYKLFLYFFFAPGGIYRIARIERGPQAIYLTLEPKGRGARLQFSAGQFGFLSVLSSGLREPHPFSIASVENEKGTLHFVIRVLGDYTKTLYERAEVGMTASVQAPYGRFTRPSTASQELWIGAGVGITPFISWLQDQENRNFHTVSLVYCFDPERAFPSFETIQNLSEQAGVTLVPNPSGGQALKECVRQAAQQHDPTTIHISYCGPQGLLHKLQELMQELGIPEQNIQFELFEFR